MIVSNNIQNNMLKRQSAALLFMILMSQSINASAECVASWNGEKSATSLTNINLKLSGDIKKNQELGRFDFGPPDKVLTGIQCTENTDIYAYASDNKWGSEPKFYDIIDGKPAYFIGEEGYFAYVMVDNESGLPYRTHPASVLKTNSGILQPRSTSLIVYAAKDNPKKTRVKRVGTGFLRMYKDITAISYGIKYDANLNIEPAQPICTIENKNLEISLKRISTSAFPEMGYPGESTSETGNLILFCTGELNSSIKISMNNYALLNGKQSVVVPDNDGQSGNSSGVGFVLSSPLSNDEPFINNTSVSLGKLNQGSNQIPIKAGYYRYSKNIQPGKATATVSFIISFN